MATPGSYFPTAITTGFAARRTGFAACPVPAAAAAELKSKAFEQVAEGSKDIIDILKSGTSSGALDSRMPQSIVSRALVRVAQNFECLGGFLKTCHGFVIIRIAVRVKLDRQLFVSLLQVFR